MNDNIQEMFPCIRGCLFEPIGDEPGKPKPAKHGHLCNSCFYRLTAAFKLIPDLMANMRAQVSGIGGVNYSDRVTGGGDGSPAPLRIGPLDASDSLFAKLVSWTEVIGGLLHTPQPSVAVWRNLSEVQGSRQVTFEVAQTLAWQLAEWFTSRLETIAGLPIAAEIHDDICYGWEDARGVFSLSGAYGVEPRPIRAADKRECPVCGAKEVFVKWPDVFDSEVAVICDRCKWVAEPEKYGFYAHLFAS